MQAAIKKEFGITADLKEGYGGIFEVAINGQTVSTNRTTGRFPDNEEIFTEIRKRQ